MLVQQKAPVSSESAVPEPSGGAGLSEIPDTADAANATSLDAGVSASKETHPQRRNRRVHRPFRQQRRAYRVAVIK